MEANRLLTIRNLEGNQDWAAGVDLVRQTTRLDNIFRKSGDEMGGT